MVQQNVNHINKVLQVCTWLDAISLAMMPMLVIWVHEHVQQ